MSTSRSTTSELVQWLVGFFGAALFFAIVPRLVQYVTRRVVGRFLFETLAVALVGVLFERGIGLLDRK